jgi:hypothetical protein
MVLELTTLTAGGPEGRTRAGRAARAEFGRRLLAWGLVNQRHRSWASHCAPKVTRSNVQIADDGMGGAQY